MVTSPCCNQLTKQRCTSVSCTLWLVTVWYCALALWQRRHGQCLIRVPYITPPFCSLAYSYPSYTFSLRFVPTRISYRSMHQAVDNVLLDTIFPASPSMNTTMLPEKLHEELTHAKDLVYSKNTWLNSSQRMAIQSMLDPECRMVSVHVVFWSCINYTLAGTISCNGTIWVWKNPHTVWVCQTTDADIQNLLACSYALTPTVQQTCM